jgi:hypothetical protein
MLRRWHIVAPVPPSNEAFAMLYMNLSVALIAGLMLFEPFTRISVSRFANPRTRRSLATRSYFQAGAALLAAMLVATSQPSPERMSPLLVIGIVVLLVLAGIYWIVRGKRLLKPRRVFRDLH